MSVRSTFTRGISRRTPRNRLRNLFFETLEDRTLLAAVATDKFNYLPGETAKIFATGYRVGDVLQFQVLHNDGTPNTGSGHLPWYVADGGTGDLDRKMDGKVETSWYVHPDDSLNSSFTLTAKGLVSGLTASTTFIDANPSATLDQCANDPAPSPSTDGCSAAASDWVNGNLGASKSSYFEDNSIPYRIVMDNLTLASHTITIEWDTTQGGKHAIDYLTSFDRTVATANPCLGVTGCGAASTFPIPADPQVTGAGVTPVAGNFTIYGGTITSVSPYTYPDGPGFVGNKTARITITFTATQANPVLAWGGHISRRADWGPDGSAVSISGSPFHTRLIDLDGAGGNQDRSLSADAVIFPASITIIKDAVPNSPQDFAFTTTGGLSPANFNLDDDADATLSNTQTYSNILVTATNGNNYTISETQVPGWALTFNTPVCTVTSPNGGSQSAADADTININLREGENVTCTFINTAQNGTIVVDKVTIPGSDPQSFNFDASGGSYADFSLTDADPPNSQSLPAGTYSVSETVPAGWNLTSATCVSSIGDAETPANLELDAGETITCTFTNTKQGRIIVEKQTDPNGSAQSFEFDPSYAANFFLTDGQQNDSGFLAPGPYSVAEVNLPAGWTLTSTNCTSSIGDVEAAGNLELDAGETITCVFTNTQAGRIIVEKQTLPDGSAQSFEFDPSYAANFFLTDGQQNDSGFLAPGPYSVAEVNLPAGWTLTSTNCTSSIGDVEAAGNLELDAGETITCVFTNTQAGRIIVEKQTDPNGSAQPFEFDPSYAANFFLTDGQQNDSGFLAPGPYSVAEVNLPAGWTLTSTNCTSSIGDVEAAGNLELDAGETITCVFTDTQAGRIIVEKQTLPDGSAQSFEFDPSYAANFFLTDGQQNDSGFLAPGPYSVAEVNLPAGWTLTSTNCTSSIGDVEAAGNLELDAGETITCVFTNTQAGRIIVEKQTLPDGSAQSFEFDPSYGANFFLTDGQQNDSGFLAPGAYSVAEVNLPAGWTLTSANCSDGSPVNNISLQPGETVTCVFTDTQAGRIIVEKQTLPDGSAQSFEFDPSYAGNFFLTDGQQNNSGFLAPGAYSVAEVNLPAGWTLTSTNCTSSIGDVEAAGNLELDAGETITCVFTNTQAGRIIVEKQTLPDGSAQSFEFDPSYGANFFLTDGQQNNSGFLAPGAYSVAEVNLPAGWTLTSATCSDGSPVNNISLQPGETVTCVFTDTQAGRIIVEKQTLPDGSVQSFEFDPSYAGNFFLTDGQQNNSGFLAPGAYSVAEVNLPAGWTLTSTNCTSSIGDVEAVGNLELDAGETITCVFTNTQAGRIIVEKQTDPDGDPTLFEFDPSYGANFFLSDGQQNDSGFLPAGPYSVVELPPVGAELSNVTCTSSLGGFEDNTAINLQAGETVTCVFSNEKDSYIIVEKQTLPDGSAQSFEFDPSYAANFFLTDGQQSNSGDLDPGVYSVAEINLPSGWSLTSIVCNSSLGGVEDNLAINLTAGETVTCVFTDTQAGRIIVEKQTLPDGSAQSFEFDPSYAGNFFLTDGQQNNSGFLAPGAYSVAEVNLPAGWTLTSTNCTSSIGDVEAAGNLELDAGETITCVFTDTQAGRIIVEKQTLPDGSAQSFEFDPSYGANFFLTDGQQNNSGFLAPGAYSVAEVNLPAGWTLTSATCSDGSPVNNISLQPGETVTCVFTDTQAGRIIVEKQTLPDGSAQSFEFDPSYAGNFFLTDGQQNDSGFLAPGPYSVAEVNLPAGWTLTSTNCTSSIGDVEAAGNLELDAGETITCVFTNTQAGRIIVEKQTLPDGSAQSFEFDPSYGANFFLTDGQQNDSGFLAPGAYSVAEVNLPAGWTLTSANCSDGSPVNNISLQPGETVTCVFTDTQAGRIIVEKQTLPDGSAQSFEFDPSYAGNFFLTDGQQNNSGFLAPGAYSVAEVNLPAGWTLTSTNCTSSIGDVEAAGNLELDAGETITCVFTNTQAGRIIVEKQTLPDGSAQSFEFDPSYGANFFLTDGQQNNSGFLAPGAYSVAEVNLPAGWTLTSATCSDGSPVNNISLQPGETVTCVFTDTQAGRIIVEKQTLPDGSAQSFEFDPSYAGNFFLTDGQQNNSGFLAPGAYSVAEVNLPAGWTLTSTNCTSSIGDVEAAGNLELDAGETITCVFTNTQAGRIIVEKQTLPDGSAQSFEFDPSYGANFFLTDGQQNDSGFLAPGAYSVAEVNLPAGWTLTSANCSDGSPVNNISLQPGETVTCVFTDTQSGTIAWEKRSAIAPFALQGGATFVISPDPIDGIGTLTVVDNGPNDANPANGQFLVINVLPGGPYTITETVAPAGSKLDPDPTRVVTVAPGEDAVIGVQGRDDPGTTDESDFHNPPKVIVVTPDKGNCSLPYVHIVNATTGDLIFRFKAFDENLPDDQSYQGGIRVATGDITGDGIDEIIVAPGRNYLPLVRIFTQDGVLLEEFLAYPTTFNGGIELAIGDVNADGQNDIVTAMSYNGNEVRVFRNPNGTVAGAPTPFHPAYDFGTTATPATSFSTFSPYGTSFKGGATVAVADMGTVTGSLTLNNTPDNRDEIIVGNGSGMRSTIYVYGFFPVPVPTTTSAYAFRMRTYLPFTSTYKGGVFLDVARVNADAIPDILASTGNGGGSLVQVLNGINGALIKQVTAYPQSYTSSYNAPVHVKAVDDNGDGIADYFLTAQGSDGSTRMIRKFDFDPLNPNAVDEIMETSSDFCGAYFLATLDDDPNPIP